MTTNQRGSAINVALPFGRVLPVPDGATPTAGDRQQLAMSYALTTEGTTVYQLAALGVG